MIEQALIGSWVLKLPQLVAFGLETNKMNKRNKNTNLVLWFTVQSTKITTRNKTKRKTMA